MFRVSLNPSELFYSSFPLRVYKLVEQTPSNKLVTFVKSYYTDDLSYDNMKTVKSFFFIDSHSAYVGSGRILKSV